MTHLPPIPPGMSLSAMWEDNCRLNKLVEELQEKLKKLTEELRDTKRSKAPFGKGKRKTDPKKPGRRKGEGVFKNREAPIVTETDVVERLDAPVPPDLRMCPNCNKPLEFTDEIATTIDVPPVPQRIIKEFIVEVGCCPHCGWSVRGTHPALKIGQHGACAHVVGPEVTAQALHLHYSEGLPLRRVPGVIRSLTGIAISQSALTQSAIRLTKEGGTLATTYEQLRLEIPSAKVVHTDDTGWRVDAVGAFLMGFFTERTAYYQIRQQHRAQEVQEVIPADYDGSVVVDGGPSYRAKSYEAVVFQRCLSHFCSNIKKVEESKGPRSAARKFCQTLKELLQEGIQLWNEHEAEKIKTRTYRRRGRELKQKLTSHLAKRKLRDADSQRLLDGIGMAHDNGQVLLFLEKPGVPPTNNYAERMLRPAVIARKVSQCSKNNAGARAYSVMKSILVTMKVRGVNAVKGLAGLLRGQPADVAMEVPKLG